MMMMIEQYIELRITKPRDLSYNHSQCFDIYTSGQKYRITVKNEEKDIVFNF